MPSLIPAANPPVTSALSNIHYETVRKNIPDWVIKAPPDIHQGLRKASPHTPEWFEKARRSMPDVVQQLQRTYALHRLNEQQVNQLLARLPAPEAFAEPLLSKAIEERFGLKVDVNSTWLFHARRIQMDQSFERASKDPIVKLQNALKAATQTLLMAALQNFEAWEAAPGGMDQPGGRRSAIYADYPITGITVSGATLAIAPEQFADLCHTLDLGGKYQALIKEVLTPASSPGDAPDAATSNVRGLFKLFEESAFTLQVHLACMKNAIPIGAHSALLALTKSPSPIILDGRPLTCSFLQLWDIQLSGIVVIGKDRSTSNGIEKIFVYIPDDPFHPLKEYDSALQFSLELRDRLLKPGYLKFFQRFVPARQRNRLLNKIDEVFFPKVWNSAGWYEKVMDRNGKLRLKETDLSDSLLSELYRQKIAVLQDDALFHAVPSATEDQKSFDDKLRYFAEVTFGVLNVAAFVVPVLGQIMLAVTAVQLCYEVYEGIESLAEGEKEQAWAYLVDVVENVALMAALGAAASGAGGVPAVQVPKLVEGMHPVQLPDGGTRLWKPDLAPFAHDIVLPASVKPNALGLYDYQGQQWLSLEGHTYKVKPATATTPPRLQHPTRPDAYEPGLRHNNAGAWLHELDQPLDWQGLMLFRRLGQAGSAFDDITASRILQVSDTHESVLRRVLAEGERPPALLDDTMQRFQIDQELAEQIASGDDSVRQQRSALFQARYQALQTSEEPEVSLIQRVYPGLPRSIAEELLRHASPAELEQLRVEQRLPLRLGEEVRVYQQQVRLTRAYEGLYLDSVNNPDTDKLLLHSLETLPGWPTEMRLEVRSGAFNGPLIDSIGPTNASTRKILIKDADGYLTRDADDQHLHGRDNLYAAVMHALPDAQRQALGLPHVGQGPNLKSALQTQPLMPRQTLAEVLGMQARKPGGKSPMRLADGRLGYPLSGRGAMSGYIVRETLLDKVRLLELSQPPEQTLRALENTGLSRVEINQRLDQLLSEQQALRSSLDVWAQASAERPMATDARRLSRERIGEAIWELWRTSNLPEIGRDSGHLRLDGVSLTDFPEQLPAFIEPRVQALQLSDLIMDGANIMADYDALEQFFGRFPQVTSLAIGRSAGAAFAQPLAFGLPGLIADSFSGIMDLRLINQRMLLGQHEIDAFRRMPRLQILDLSGNRLGLAPPTNLSGLNLRYLGMERMGLNEWPQWLNDLLPGRIAELSLADNHITDVPDSIVGNAPESEFHTRISLRGNVLSRGTTIRARLGETGTHGRFSFDLDVPAELEDHLKELMRQRVELQEAVVNWAEASSSSAPLDEARVQARREIGDMLQIYWRNVSERRGFGILDLDSINLDDFPRALPSFFYERVVFMELERVTATSEQLNRFLRDFPKLVDLTIRDHATSLTRLPSALLELPSLSTLRLLNQRIVIDQRVVDFLARLPSLDHLELDGNTLGTITDVSGLAARRLQRLALNNVGLQSWPNWLSELMTTSMETLNLEDNDLTELPEHILQNPRSLDSHTEIGLHGNPLTHETMRRAHTSESYGHAYSFGMELPPDILALEYDTSSQDSSSGTPRHAHSPRSVSSHELATVEPWLNGAVDEEPQRRAIWQQLESNADAQDLLNLVGRLEHTADYRTSRNRPELIARVWRVLRAAAQDTELRLTLNGMSEEPLRLLQDHDTCPDGVRLEFNQMEVLIYTRQALLDVPKAQRGQSLYRLTRRLYRLHELDRIAREQAGSRDEAEVRLAYRLRWAQELDLPLPPGSMLYRTHAQLRPGELDAALGRVRQGEHSEPFMGYAAQRDFWVEYLRENYTERFRQLKEAYEASVLELLDLYPDDNPDQSAARITALEDKFKRDEQNLIRELTNREGQGLN